jgi:ParB-like chromosome segregation protein Spo0J
MNIPKQIVMWAADKLAAYKRNARTHSAKQVDQVAASIKEFGWTSPIVVDGNGTIIAGHARLAAALQLGMTEVPTIVLTHLTPQQKQGLVIADNKLALNAGWDDEILREQLTALDAAGFDLDLVGFSDEEIEALLGKAEEPASDGGGLAAGVFSSTFLYTQSLSPKESLMHSGRPGQGAHAGGLFGDERLHFSCSRPMS